MQAFIQVANKAIQWISDFLSSIDNSDAIQQLNDDSSRKVYTRVFGYEQDEIQFIIIQYWLFYPVDMGNWLLNLLLFEQMGLDTMREGDWEMVQVVLKQPSGSVILSLLRFAPIAANADWLSMNSL